MRQGQGPQSIVGAEADTRTERESNLRQKPQGSVRALSETEAMKQSKGRGKLLLQ